VELPERKLNDTELRVMKTYLDDVVQKLSVFDAVLDRVDLLTSVLNEKLLFKTFRVSRDQGFVFISDEGREIPLAGLSSGEQHELVLLYDLLFNVPTGSLVMIDEPEISLHVSWQRRFMADMQRIANIGRLRFVVATHSPQIVDEWWPYTVELARGWD
jgi:predicted ATP-binding protein involved in virulence